MKTQIIQATSSLNAMPAETNNRRFSVFNDGIDATEVQERLDWKALRDMITVDTSLLEFMPTGQHHVAALANLGAELVQEVKAYRPGFAWKSSPAEIVGALIEEMASPTIEAKPQLAPGEREEFDGWFGDTSKRGYVHNEVSAFSGWLAAKRAALAAALVQAVPNGWKLVPIQPTEEMVLAPGAIHTRGNVARIHRDVWKRMLDAAPTAPAAQNAAAAFARQLVDSGAENYIGQAFDTECGDIEVTARYTFGKTPAEKLADLEAAISAAQADARDAAAIANKIVRDVGELDRDSPADQPGMMLVTADELQAIIIAAIDGGKAGAS